MTGTEKLKILRWLNRQYHFAHKQALRNWSKGLEHSHTTAMAAVEEGKAQAFVEVGEWVKREFGNFGKSRYQRKHYGKKQKAQKRNTRKKTKS